MFLGLVDDTAVTAGAWLLNDKVVVAGARIAATVVIRALLGLVDLHAGAVVGVGTALGGPGHLLAGLADVAALDVDKLANAVHTRERNKDDVNVDVDVDVVNVVVVVDDCNTTGSLRWQRSAEGGGADQGRGDRARSVHNIAPIER